MDLFAGKLVQVGCSACHDPLVVGTEIEPADIVPHDDQNVWSVT